MSKKIAFLCVLCASVVKKPFSIHLSRRGMPGFTLVWAGQLVSVLASNMSQFALIIWAYEQTGSATVLGGISTVYLVPFLLLSPIAGVMVDRYNRKLMMMVSDLAAVSATAAILILHAAGQLQVWHLFAASVLNGLGQTFQWPAYSSAISTMLPKEQYSRANGMMGLIDTGPGVFSPVMAGALLPIIGLTGILSIDVVTFFLAIGALLLVHVPQPARTVEGQAGKGSLLQEGVYGFKYIFARRGLLSLLVFFLILNFVIGLAFPVYQPFILASTGNNSEILGIVSSAGAVGGVLGGLLVSAWGGFKRRMKTIFLSEALIGFFALFLFGLGRGLPLWVGAGLLGGIFPLTSNGASQAIWQTKVAPDVQGRVFAVRRMIAWVLTPITPLVAGALADFVTEPAMRGPTLVAQVFGGLLGNAPGSGMALQFVLAGLLYMLVVLLGFLFFPTLRNLEESLPDHDQLEKAG